MNQSHRYFDVQAYSINHRSLVSARFYDRTRKRLYMTDSPNWVNNRTTSVEYRFLSSMQGSMGVGGQSGQVDTGRLRHSKGHDRGLQAGARDRTTRLSLPAHLSAGKQRIFRDGVCLARQAAGCPLHLSALQSERLPFRCVYLRGLDPTRQYHLCFIHSEGVGCSGGRQQKLLDEPWRHVLLRETFKPQVCLVLILTSRLV
jgi:hypothetical protein